MLFRSDECRIAEGWGSGVVDVPMRADAGDFAAIGKGEPKLAVLAHRDRERPGASTDRDAPFRHCLGGSAAGRENERGDAAGEFETKLALGGNESCNRGCDEMKINFHGWKTLRHGLRIAKGSR